MTGLTIELIDWADGWRERPTGRPYGCLEQRAATSMEEVAAGPLGVLLVVLASILAAVGYFLRGPDREKPTLRGGITEKDKAFRDALAEASKVPLVRSVTRMERNGAAPALPPKGASYNARCVSRFVVARAAPPPLLLPTLSHPFHTCTGGRRFCLKSWIKPPAHSPRQRPT